MNTKSCPICGEPVSAHTKAEVLACLEKTYHGDGIPQHLDDAIAYAVGASVLKGFGQSAGNATWQLSFKDEGMSSSEPYLDIMRKILQFSTPLKHSKKSKVVAPIDDKAGPLTEEMQADQDHSDWYEEEHHVVESNPDGDVMV